MSLLSQAKKQLAAQSKHAPLNAFITLADRTSILSSAEAADAANAASLIPGRHGCAHSLHGRLIAVKDNICTADLQTTAASRILENFVSPYDATVVRQLRNAGALVAGKTNMDEFGMGSDSKHSHFGAVKMEGWREDYRSAGGSSGGSAVAVATGQCWAALGTDTGGSVRLPAAYTGVVGFKPSYGLLSRWGVIAYANSLDTVGILSRDVGAARSIFDVLNSHDPQDPTSLSFSTRKRLPCKKTNNANLRVGIPLDYHIATLHPLIRKAWLHSLHILQSLGHTLHPIRLRATQHALSAYYVLAPAEASSNLAKYDGVRYGSRSHGADSTPDSVLFAKTRGEGFGAEVKRRILLGAFTLSAQALDNYFIQAQKVRRLVQRDFDRAFDAPNELVASPAEKDSEGVDVILCPTVPAPAPLLSEVEEQNPVHSYMNDIFTVPSSLAGLPAISVPVRMSAENSSLVIETQDAGPKTGMQIIGQYGHDELVLDVAAQLMEAAGS